MLVFDLVQGDVLGHQRSYVPETTKPNIQGHESAGGIAAAQGSLLWRAQADWCGTDYLSTAGYNPPFSGFRGHIRRKRKWPFLHLRRLLHLLFASRGQETVLEPRLCPLFIDAGRLDRRGVWDGAVDAGACRRRGRWAGPGRKSSTADAAVTANPPAPHMDFHGSEGCLSDATLDELMVICRMEPDSDMPGTDGRWAGPAWRRLWPAIYSWNAPAALGL